jgi:hypothetical protein
LTRPGPFAPVPLAVVALAVVAWLASPQEESVLRRAAHVLEEAGTFTVLTEVQAPGAPALMTRVDVDLRRDVVVVHDPEPGVERRLVTPSGVYERLADETWLLLVDGAPPLFGQDPVGQLRSLDASVERAGRGRYRLRYRLLGAEAEGELLVDRDGAPIRLTSSYDLAGRTATLSWEVVDRGVPVDADPPASARPVDARERDGLLAGSS